MATIAVLNVNTTTTMTDAMVQAARPAAGPDIDVIGLTPATGVPACEGHVDSAYATVAMLETLRAYEGELDAVILAGVGDGSVEALREFADVPVIDVTEAAAMTALNLGDSFSFVTTVPRAIGMISDRLRIAGLDDKLASVRASGLGVLELEGDDSLATLVEQAKFAVERDSAEVICLGCCGMASLDAAVSDATGVPVVDPVPAAVAIAAGIVRQRLATSRIRRYAPFADQSAEVAP